MSKGGNKSGKSSEPHGNSFQNTSPHHLYEIWDQQEDETFKYGISDSPIGKDDLSDRVRRQVQWMNIVAGFFRFFGRILVKNISGKEQAERIEDEYLDAFYDKNGRFPRGNLVRNRKKEI